MKQLRALVTLAFGLTTCAAGQIEQTHAVSGVEPSIACRAKLVCFSEIRRDGNIEVWMETYKDKPVTVAFTSKVSDVSGETNSFSKAIFAPTHEKVLNLVTPARGSWGYRWRYNTHIGSETVMHDNEVVYRLPYASGQSFTVIQGFNGTYTHTGRYRYAIDWRMRVGTRILAARGGVVVGTRDDSKFGKGGEENFIWIQHSDGTVGHYLHLKQGGVLVSEGQEIRAGDAIGISGNTGFSTEPHLHFHVSTPTPGERDAFKTFPIVFRVSGGSAVRLQEGRSYVAE